MKRILLVLTVALVMAAMMVATAVPAFGVLKCQRSTDTTTTCQGGGGSGGGGIGGGSGGQFSTDTQRTFLNFTGGGGMGGSGSGTGAGHNCKLNQNGTDCVGKGFTGGP